MAQNLRLLWLLVRLRYQLLWAQARTSAGKAAIFFALYLVGTLTFAVVALGGIGGGVMAARGGHTLAATQAILGSLFATGLTVSLMMGIGPSTAFSDPVLRRYPLSARWRFIAQHMVGILDPVWIFISATLFGLCAGFQIMRIRPLFVSLPTVLFFLAASYLCCATLIVLVRRIFQFRVGPLILMVASVVVFLAFIALTSSNLPGDQLWHYLENLVSLTPAVAAAGVLSPGDTQVVSLSAVMLVAWVVVGAIALRFAQSLAPALSVGGTVDVNEDSGYEIAASFFPQRMRPLVSKSLRYHLRCNRVRYSLLMTGPLLLFIHYMGHHVGSDTITLLLSFMFIAGFFSTLVMSVNYFGWDGAGVRRYPLLPVSLIDVLRANSFASILLGACGALLTVTIGLAAAKLNATPNLMLFLLFDAIAGLLFFHAIALWIAVLAPRRADFNTMMGNVVSLPAKLVLICGMVPVMVVNSGLGISLGRYTDRWPWMAAAASLCLAFYWISLALIAPVLNRRREQLVQLVAGAASN
jgi:hypothetical protein